MQKNHEIYINSLAKDIKNLFGIDLPKDKFQYTQNIEKSFLKEIQTPTTLLKSVFDKVTISEKENDKTHSFYKSEILQLEENIFPEQNIAFNQNDFDTLKKGFENELKNIPDNSLQTLIFLLKKYAFYLPANKNLDYVSAFEHIKIRASLAQCYQLAKTENEKIPFLMLCADISGIQSFIYNIASAKAGKSLKGRSFYLQLLMDSIIQKILTYKDIDLHIGHQVYASGGKAYLLLPNTEKVRKAIDKLEKEIEGKIWQEHKESLYVILSYLPFAENDLQNVGENIYKKLGDTSAEKKSQKYKNLFLGQTNDKNNFDYFFGGKLDKKGNEVRCAVTGESIDGLQEILQMYESKLNAIPRPFKEIISLKQNLDTYLLDEESDKKDWVFVLPNVKQQVQLGKDLKDLKYIVTSNQKINEHSDWINPANLGIYHCLNSEGNFLKEFDLSKISILKINNVENKSKKDNTTTYVPSGFTFYGGNEQPLNKENKPKNFEELAGYENENDKGKGFHKLGVLRMDVDGMGGVFATGMKGMPLSAFSTISAYLDIFFAGYLNKIRENDDFKDDIMILYAGGDDIFAIGKWDKIILFSEQISQQFKEFVNHREKISISGGIAIAHAKYPIAKFAEEAGDAEHKAKHFNNNQKNAICFLGETVSWDKEFEFVREMKDKFVSFENDLSSGFLQRLILFKTIKDKHTLLEVDKNKQKPDLSYKWNSAYYLSQSKNKYKNKNQKIVDFISDLEQKLLVGNDRNFDLIALACRWAELEKRQNKNNEN